MSATEIVVMRLQGRFIERGATVLSEAERERAARLRSGPERGRFIETHAMLRQLLGVRCGAAPGSLQIEYGPHGKPALVRSDLQFSVSRSANLVAFAFACGRAVGVDIEAIRPLAEADAIAARIFSPQEQRRYAALGRDERLAGFFRGWTRSEALAKARGVGLAAQALRAQPEPFWAVHSFFPAAGYAAALAAQRAH